MSFKSLTHAHLQSNTKVFVEDTSLYARGESCDEVLEKLVAWLAAFGVLGHVRGQPLYLAKGHRKHKKSKKMIQLIHMLHFH